MNNQNQTSPKTKQFQEELNELLKKYQYTLVPEIVVTRNGIIPQIMIRDILPPKGNPTEPIIEKVPAKKVSKKKKK